MADKKKDNRKPLDPETLVSGDWGRIPGLPSSGKLIKATPIKTRPTKKLLLIDASYMSVTECVVVTWSDHSAFAVPIEWFRHGPSSHKVDPLNLKIIDDGQTLVLGEYEVDVEAIWFEFDKPPA